MINLLHNLLSSDATVSGLTGTKIYYSYREQKTGTPAIVLDWVSTDDGYALGGMRCDSIYTVDVVAFANNLGTLHSLTQAIISALDSYSGTVNTPEGITYNVVACQLLDRNFETAMDSDTHEGTLTFEITISN